jgi:hypothetical protein
LSQSATITVESVQPVEGVSKKTNKPWKKYVVHASGTGVEFQTFDGTLAQSAYQLVGKRAQVLYDIGQYGNDLTDIRETDAAEDFRAVADNGAPDWDLIGLQKVRCALWKELLGPTMVAATERWSAAHPDAGQGEFARWVASFGSSLRMAAEADIYSNKRPAVPDDLIPF